VVPAGEGLIPRRGNHGLHLQALAGHPLMQALGHGEGHPIVADQHKERCGRLLFTAPLTGI
jgi:hypothetical protein